MSHPYRSSTSFGGLAVIALCAFAPVVAAQRAHPTPAPLLAVEWGTPADSLMPKAAAAGWEFLAIDEDGDYAFHTKLDGEEALVFATFGTNGLTRLVVSVNPHAGAELTFRHMVDTLRAYFGPAVLASGEETGLRPAPSLIAATAWQGIMMGLRRDLRIIIMFTCPASSPQLPVLNRGIIIA
jgi:hypothetical protein